MRYPAAETAEKHVRILEEASRLFRENGFGGVSLGEIMKATGLTHGPFYNHFASKDALVDESVEHAAAGELARMDAFGAAPDGMRAYVESYLSTTHRDAAGQGCLLAALGPDAARLRGVRAVMSAYVGATIERFMQYVPWKRRQDPRGAAIRLYALLVGALVLSRAVDDAALSGEILDRAREDAGF